jgi:hypothetical protein
MKLMISALSSRWPMTHVLLLLQCLPLCVDVGCNNPKYVNDPDYRGIKQPRITGKQLGHAALLLPFSRRCCCWVECCSIKTPGVKNGYIHRTSVPSSHPPVPFTPSWPG